MNLHLEQNKLIQFCALSFFQIKKTVLSSGAVEHINCTQRVSWILNNLMLTLHSLTFVESEVILHSITPRFTLTRKSSTC